MHRKTKRLKVDFSMDIEVHHITDIFEGERYVGNLARTIAQGKASLLNDLKNSDGVATSHCLTRPVYKLLSIALDERSYAEKEDWNKVLEVAAKAARIRAIQLHLSIYSNLKFQLPYTTSSSGRPRQRGYPLPSLLLNKGSMDDVGFMTQDAAKPRLASIILRQASGNASSRSILACVSRQQGQLLPLKRCGAMFHIWAKDDVMSCLIVRPCSQ